MRFAQTMTASEKKKKKIPGKISFFYVYSFLGGCRTSPSSRDSFFENFFSFILSTEKGIITEDNMHVRKL